MIIKIYIYTYTFRQWKQPPKRYQAATQKKQRSLRFRPKAPTTSIKAWSGSKEVVSNIESKAWQGETPKKHPAELLETVFGSTVGVQFDGFFWGWWLLMIDKLTLRAYCKYTQRNEIVKIGMLRVWSLRNSKNICCTRLRIDGKQFFQERKPASQGTWRNPMYCFHSHSAFMTKTDVVQT